MAQHKVSNLKGVALDEAVATALGVELNVQSPGDQPWGTYPGAGLIRWQPSTSWELGGAILERECIELSHSYAPGGWAVGEAWLAIIRTTDGHRDSCESGSTPLVAAMRALVAHKIGSTIEA
jgi:hypothetical protein